MSTIDQQEFAGVEILVPGLDEQKEIIAYLQFQAEKIDLLIKMIRKGIKLLEEYRTALISAAVTGKIDVRGEVVR
jgi:type I restriction enzyme S subunit